MQMYYIDQQLLRTEGPSLRSQNRGLLLAPADGDAHESAIMLVSYYFYLRREKLVARDYCQS
jgi:hypothetical protein